MDAGNLKQCRLVCSKWNQEITSHAKLHLIIRDRIGKGRTAHRNLDFIHAVNAPSSFTVQSLSKRNYKNLRLHNLQNLEQLSFKYISRTLVNDIDIKFFSDNCCRLTSLTFQKPTLGEIDFYREAALATEINPAQIRDRHEPKLFPNLKHLVISQYDKYDLLYESSNYNIRQLVHLTSKNILFLLNKVCSYNIQSLSISINEEFIDINASLPRIQFRFEQYVLPQYLCFQPNIRKLDLGIPPSMPGVDWSAAIPTTDGGKLPTGITHISIDHRVSQSQEYLLGGLVLLGHPSIPEWVPGFYAEAEDWTQSEYWRLLILAQTRCENLYFNNYGSFGEINIFFSTLMNKNSSTLTTIILESAWNAGCLDASVFTKSTCLRELNITNFLFGPVKEDDARDVHLDNVKALPMSLKVFALKNITVPVKEMQSLSQNENLKSLELVYSRMHYMDLIGDEVTASTLKLFLRQRSLDRLVIGSLKLNKENPAAVDFEQFQAWLDNWSVLGIV